MNMPHKGLQEPIYTNKKVGTNLFFFVFISCLHLLSASWPYVYSSLHLNLQFIIWRPNSGGLPPWHAVISLNELGTTLRRFSGIGEWD